MNACQTTRDFALIDQDQSDNAVAHYLFNPNTGQTSQATAANRANLPGDTVETNGSDNGLLDSFIDPTLGCTPFTATNPTNPAGASASQALNELSARQHQKGTVAQLPVNDPQLLVGGQFSIGKTNVYRIETDMPTLPFDTNTTQNAAQYCQEHGQHRDAQAAAGRAHGNRHCLAGAGGPENPGPPSPSSSVSRFSR